MAIKSIGIDIREAASGGAGKARYAREITKALLKVAPPELRFYLFTNKLTPTFPTSERIKQIALPSSKLFWHLRLRRTLKIHPVDIFLAPTSYIFPALAPRGQKIALVVHDIVAFLLPESLPWASRLLETAFLRRAIQNSRFLISVSQNTEDDLKRIVPEIAHKKIVIAHPAVSPGIHETHAKSLNLPRRFLLCVGTLEPRKNLETVLAAFTQIADREKDLHLVIVGAKGWKTGGLFSSIPSPLRHRIHFLGHVDDKKLSELYSRAQIFVYPSLYEGFGIPPLEAMACGCPVITSSVSSLPEVVGEAALTVDPTNEKALAGAILKLLGPQIREIYKKRGLKRAAEFSWEKSAKIILSALYSSS